MSFQKKAAGSAVSGEPVGPEVDPRDRVKIGQPGIVWFAPGDKGGKPAPALVTGVGGKRTLQLMTATYSGWRYDTGARHYRDPELLENHELNANVGTWAFYDEL